MEMSSETLVQSRLSITSDGRASLNSPEDGHDKTEITNVTNMHVYTDAIETISVTYIHMYMYGLV